MAALAGGEAERGFLQLFLEVPVVTRFYTMLSLILTLAVNFEIISQFDIYLNPDLIVNKHQYWRLITPFLYAGPFNFSTAFNLLFGYRYSRILEETFYFRRSADYLFMHIFLSLVILTSSLFFSTNLLFLGHSLTHAILYLWCRRNPRTRVLIFGLMTLQANHVPYVLVGLSILTGSPLAADGIAILAGHCYYFLEDVFPQQRVGFRILRTPRFLKALFDELPESHERIDVVDENNNLIQNNAQLQ